MLRVLLVLCLSLADAASLLIAAAAGVALASTFPFLKGTELADLGLEPWILAAGLACVAGANCLLPMQFGPHVQSASVIWLAIAALLVVLEMLAALVQPWLAPNPPQIVIVLSVLAAINLTPGYGAVLARLQGRDSHETEPQIDSLAAPMADQSGSCVDLLAVSSAASQIDAPAADLMDQMETANPAIVDSQSISARADNLSVASGSSRQRAFDPELRVEHTIPLSDLGTGKRADAVRIAVTALIANMLLGVQEGSSGQVHYARDRNRYRSDRYRPKWMTYGSVTKAVGFLVQSGLAVETRARPSSLQTRRSKMAPTHQLLELLGPPHRSHITVEPTEPIALRDAAGKPVDYDDTPLTNAMRADVRAHNSLLAALAVDLTAPRIDRLAPEMIRYTGQIYCLTTAYRRIFNIDWNQGGRWYADIQNLPKELRATLTIDGEPTFEYDLRACHFRLLTALAKLPDVLATGADPFALPGLERRLVKFGFNVLLNASSVRSAQSALAIELRNSGIPEAHLLARQTVDVVVAAFPQFEGYSDVCAEVQRRMREQAVPVISIHDSFISAARYAATLKMVVDEVFELICAELRKA
jgi:hypothetical protein